MQQMKTFLVSIVSFCVAFSALRTQSVAGIVPTFVNNFSRVDIFSPEYQQLYFFFTVELTAEDEDIYLNNYFNFIPEGPGGSSLGSYMAGFSLSSPALDPIYTSTGDQYYLLEEGTTETFNFAGIIRPETSTAVRVKVLGIHWNTEPDIVIEPDGSYSGNYTPVDWDATDYQYVQGSAAPEPGSVLLTLIGGLALTSRRRRLND